MLRRSMITLLLLSISFVAHAAEPPTAAEMTKRLGRGINLGNALDAPNEGEWGVKLEREHFKVIKASGFDSVRFPIRWSAHAEKTAPYKIDGKFLARVDEILGWCREEGLLVVLNMHHYDEIHKEPEAHEERCLALWSQLAEHFASADDSLLLEPLNEPAFKLDADKWNALLAKILPIIRAKHPTRCLVVGPAQWNNFRALPKLVLPAADRRLIVTFHYYDPFQFTHQEAHWVAGSDKWKGKTWTGSAEEQAALDKDFDTVAAWAKEHDRPMYLGEFGAFSAADMESRAKWTHAVTLAAAKRGFATAYWEFCSGFGAYDAQQKEWREPLKKALLGKD